MNERVQQISDYLDTLFPNPTCELDYKKDYELLFAVVLSAQTTDKRVNSVTPILFEKYPTLEDLRDAPLSDVEKILRPIGTFQRKAVYVKEIARILLEQGYHSVPNDREFLESLPGVGRKTANVVLSNIHDVPAIAVDTHVTRVSKRLGLAKDKDGVLAIEHSLEKKFPKEVWSKRHHQMVLFGRYYCKAMKPECATCPLVRICKELHKNLPKKVEELSK